MIDNDMKRHMEDWKKVAQERPLRVMVCGLGGVGKTTLINHLLQLEGEKMWAHMQRSIGPTSVVTKFECTAKRGIKVCLFETSGFHDVNISNEMTIAMMEKETEKKLDVVFYCISLGGSARVLQGDIKAIKIMTQAFSNEIWRKTVVVFTFADFLEALNSADEYGTVIQRLKEEMMEVFQNEHVPEDIIKELPMLTSGYSEDEAAECKLMGELNDRLFLAALKQVDPAFLPALFEVRWSWKELESALFRNSAAHFLAISSIISTIPWPFMAISPFIPAFAMGSIPIIPAFTVLTPSLWTSSPTFLKIKSILRIKYMQWQLCHKPCSVSTPTYL